MDGTWKKPGLSTVQRGPLTATSASMAAPASMTRKDEGKRCFGERIFVDWEHF